jgi:3-deoxy-manno-octulosonate cytidylyltransferase (CMP-KDO synthetase)
MLLLVVFSAVKMIGVIPARYGSTRFPGKPLFDIAGKPLIQHVVERCKIAKTLSEVIVATDDDRIRTVASKFCRVEMTRSDHPSGSDRIAEIANRIDCDAIINIQGDEPLIDPSVIDSVADVLKRAEMSTAATRIKNESDYDNPNVVKVVINKAGNALYFSRRTIPYLRDRDTVAADVRRRNSPPGGEGHSQHSTFNTQHCLTAFPFLKHIGIYGYRRETLLRLVKFPVSSLENAEKLEQLRALENGIQIAVVQVEYDSIGVDTPEDLLRVEQLLRASK